MRIKVFSAVSGGPIWAPKRAEVVLEEAINQWLAENPAAKITAIHQSVAGGFLSPQTLIVSVWYTPDAVPGTSVGNDPQ